MALTAARAQRKLRISPLPILRQPNFLNHRETLATLRAAELAAWQASGGDFLHRPQFEKSDDL